MLTEKEKEVARAIQGDIPAERRPFKSLGNRLGISENDILEVTKSLSDRRVIRKFGAIVRHTKAGLTHNAMVAWAVPEDESAVIGSELASYREVTHCYERTPPLEGKYNLFSMVHFKEENTDERLRQIAVSLGISDYIVLETEQEFKKISMEYF